MRTLEAGPLGQSVPVFSPYERTKGPALPVIYIAMQHGCNCRGHDRVVPAERRLISRSLAAEDLRALQLEGDRRSGTAMHVDLEWGALPRRSTAHESKPAPRATADDALEAARTRRQQREAKNRAGRVADEGHLTTQVRASRDWAGLVDEEAVEQSADMTASKRPSTAGESGTPTSR